MEQINKEKNYVITAVQWNTKWRHTKSASYKDHITKVC